MTFPKQRKRVEESGDYGLLYIPEVESLDELSEAITFYSEDSPSFIVLDNIEDAIAEKANTLKLEAAGLDPEMIESLRVRIDTKQETFGGEKTSKLSADPKTWLWWLSRVLTFHVHYHLRQYDYAQRYRRENKQDH